MNPKISVIMGIYNCEDTLSEALDSLMNQTHQDFEVIMCDDGSKDNTYAIAQTFVERWPEKFVLLKNEQNQGLNKSLNRCLAAARGEYIARMDGDDISLPTRFEKEVAALDLHPEFAVVSTPMIYFDQNGDWRTGTAIEYPTTKDFIGHAPFFCHAPCMIRKSVFLEVDGYSEDPRTLRFEDCNLWFKIYAKGYMGFNLQEPLYKMRDDANAFKRRTLRSRMNASYVVYSGFRMLGMPWYSYGYVAFEFIKNFILGIIPQRLYMFLHKRKYSY
jgi:glycosyltransferase EpsE